MAKLLVEFNPPPNEIDVVVEAALLPDVKAGLDKLARGLAESYGDLVPLVEHPQHNGHYTWDREIGFRRARRLLLTSLILWLEGEYRGAAEISITGYDPDDDARPKAPPREYVPATDAQAQDS